MSKINYQTSQEGSAVSEELLITENLKTFTLYDNFDAMGLSNDLLRGIYTYGFEKPSTIQSKAIVPLANGYDIIAQAQSGTGKTATFTIGTLQQIDFNYQQCQALILAPTRELAQQISGVVVELGDYLGAKVHACVGGNRLASDIALLREGLHVVVGTPGRILDLLSRKVLDVSKIKVFILDEADEMLSRGFKDQIYDVFQFLPSCQVGLFSATMPVEALELTEKFMNDPLRILVQKEEITLEGIRQFYIDCEKPEFKLDTLSELYESIHISQAVIFCNTRNSAEWLSKSLQEKDHSVSVIHGDMLPEARKTCLSEFRTGQSRILITTDLLCRGIDVHGVSLVINFELPRNFENYIHRIGRCGRYGRKGVVVNLLAEEDGRRMAQLEKFYQTKIEPLPENFAEFF